MCPRRSSTSIEIGVFGTRKGDRLKVLFRKWRSKLYLDGPVCSACGKELLAHIRGGMCPECEKTSVKLGTDICGKCGRVLANEAEFCDTCIRNERAFVRARSCYVYEGAPKKFVYRLKFGGRRYLAAFIAEAMVDRYLDCDFECDCVVAVPLSAKRKRKRGYNQSELIAEELSSRLKLPLIDGALVKTKENKSQLVDIVDHLLQAAGYRVIVVDAAIKDVKNRYLILLPRLTVTVEHGQLIKIGKQREISHFFISSPSITSQPSL